APALRPRLPARNAPPDVVMVPITVKAPPAVTVNAPPFWLLPPVVVTAPSRIVPPVDRKSTRLNSSHLGISYAVFCLKKKNHHTVNISVVIDCETVAARDSWYSGYRCPHPA